MVEGRTYTIQQQQVWSGLTRILFKTNIMGQGQFGHLTCAAKGKGKGEEKKENEGKDEETPISKELAASVLNSERHTY